MKKIVSWLIVLALLVGMMPAVFAAESVDNNETVLPRAAETAAYVPTIAVGSAEAEIGDTVTLDVTVEAATFAAFGLQVIYDASALELTKIIRGEAIKDFMGFSGNADNGILSGFTTEDMDVEGVLFTLTFKVLAVGDHEVSLDIDSFNKADQSVVGIVPVAGIVSVPAPKLTMGSTNANIGDEVTVDVTIEAISAAAFGLQVLFDADVLELTKITKGEAIEDFMGFVGNKKNGTITGFHTEDMDIEGVLFTLTFTVLADGDHEVGLEIDSFNMADGSVVIVDPFAGILSAHDYQAIVTAPTCTEDGYTTHTCSVCGKTAYSSLVPALGHAVVVDKAVEATCMEDGLTEGSHCDRCGEVLVVQDVIPATGHNYEAVVTDPTCTEEGYTTHTCANCGDSYVDSYVEATGHSFEEGECVVCGAPDPDWYPLGDVNHDRKVDYLDAMQVAMFYVGQLAADGLDLRLADVNKDGKVDYLDAMRIAMFYVGQIESLAP